MTNFRKISTAIATGAVLLSSVAPAFATEVTVSGNGAFSTNGVSTSNTTTTAVTQNNTADVSNNISSNTSTGGNSAGFNTGGNTTINTGNASNDVNVSTAVNANQATVGCGCASGGTSVTVDGNGAYSENGVDVSNTNTTALTQHNDADIDNRIYANAKTGGNDAGFNTGGNTTIRTGDASSNVSVDNMANANVANIGGVTGSGTGNGNSIIISGNGAFSTNGVSFDKSSIVALTQTNDADIDNNIHANAKTGDNSADFSTGGDVRIVTGDASSDVDVSNLANFNSADVSCGCVVGNGTLLKIAGNGAFSESGIDATDDRVLAVTELNDADLDNNLHSDSKTGYNDSDFSTGDVNGDPTIRTGNADNSTTVSNEGNVNMFNQGTSLSLPGLGDLSFNFDLMGLLSFLHMSV